MKKFCCLSALFLIFVCAGSLTAEEIKGPRIEIKELQHDFGKVVAGTQATHIFEVRNAGTEPLVLERVVPS